MHFMYLRVPLLSADIHTPLGHLNFATTTDMRDDTSAATTSSKGEKMGPTKLYKILSDASEISI